MKAIAMTFRQWAAWMAIACGSVVTLPATTYGDEGVRRLPPVGTIRLPPPHGDLKPPQSDLETPQLDTATKTVPVSNTSQSNLSQPNLSQSNLSQPNPSRSRFSRTENYLPTTSKRWYRQSAWSHYDEALSLYRASAWASAEDELWRSLRAAAVDVTMGDSKLIDAPERLRRAELALREAAQFHRYADPTDPAAALRLVKTHRCGVVDARQVETAGMTPLQVSDAYLDHVRRQLTPLARCSVPAAASLDLMAAIYLARDASGRHASAVALGLRRAALVGQPGNASLAGRLGEQLMRAGLDGEAERVLDHALQQRFDSADARNMAIVQRRLGRHSSAQRWDLAATKAPQKSSPTRRVRIEQLSPEAFAQLSHDMVGAVPTRDMAGVVPTRDMEGVVPTRDMEGVVPTRVAAFSLGGDSAAQKDPTQARGVSVRTPSPSKRPWLDRVRDWVPRRDPAASETQR